MAACFDGAAGAFAYLLFILLYFPCVAAIAAVYQETRLGLHLWGQRKLGPALQEGATP